MIEQLQAQIREKEALVKECYARMGEAYFKKYNGSVPDVETASAAVEAKMHLDEIIALQDQIRAEQGIIQCKACGGDASVDDFFCPNCGHRMKEPIQESAKNVCPYCGEKVDADQMFCTKCGNQLQTWEQAEEMEDTDSETGMPEDDLELTCPYCGERLESDSVFCFNCGRKLQDDFTDAPEIPEDMGGTIEKTGTAGTCPKCNAPVDEDQLFCIECGTKL